MKKLTHEELLARQATLRNHPKLPLCIVLNNIRSLHNVGSIFRTADGAGVEKIWICGITGIPPHSKIEKASLGAEKTVPWEYREHVVECVQDLKQNGYQIVLLEQLKESVSFDQFKPKKPTCLVLGNEVEGVDEALLPLADAAIEIPMAGIKNSLNVTVACGIALYELRNALLEQT